MANGTLARNVSRSRTAREPRLNRRPRSIVQRHRWRDNAQITDYLWLVTGWTKSNCAARPSGASDSHHQLAPERGLAGWCRISPSIQLKSHIFTVVLGPGRQRWGRDQSQTARAKRDIVWLWPPRMPTIGNRDGGLCRE